MSIDAEKTWFNEIQIFGALLREPCLFIVWRIENNTHKFLVVEEACVPRKKSRILCCNDDLRVSIVKGKILASSKNINFVNPDEKTIEKVEQSIQSEALSATP